MPLEANRMRMFGNGIYTPAFIDINKNSLIVVTDERDGSSWNHNLNSAKIYKGFHAYQNSLAKKEESIK